MIEKKYAKIVNEQTKECQVGLGTNAEFYKSIGMTEMQVEQAYNGAWYVAGYAPQKPHNEEIKEQIVALENQITYRNMRAAIMGDPFAITKLTSIEAQIAELREQLEEMESEQ